MSQQTENTTIVEPAEVIEKSLIAGMMQVYLKEISTHTGQRARGDGRYSYPGLEAYWHEPDRHPFLIRNERNVVGFALVREVAGGTTLSEFFIKPEYRHLGHGTRASHDVFQRFPGKWAVRQQLTNSDAQTFWRRAVKQVDSQYGERIETTKDGRSGTVQRFVVTVDLTDDE